MKNVLILNDCKYAQSKPSLPILKFTKGDKCCLEFYLADSIIGNNDGKEIISIPENNNKEETEVDHGVDPETKEKPRKNKSRSTKGNK